MKFLRNQAFLDQAIGPNRRPLILQDVQEENLTGSKEKTKITGLENYTYRNLCLFAESQGLFVHDEKGNQYVEDYLKYLSQVTQVPNQIQTLGIPLVDESLTLGVLAQLDRLRAYNLESFLPFIMSQTSERIAQTLKLETFETFESCEAINNKSKFLEECVSYDIPVPFGRKVKSKKEALAAYQELENEGFEALYAKYSRSASGEGIHSFQFRNPNSLEDFASFLDKEDTQNNFQGSNLRIDGAIKFSESPAIVFWNTPNELQIVSTNYQILGYKNRSDMNPTIHKGSIGQLTSSDFSRIYPAIEQLKKLLDNHNAYGPGSIDLISQTTASGKKIYVVECNKRFTGGYHPFIATRFKINNFYSDVNLYCPRHKSFNDVITELESSNLLWTIEKNSGTFIANHATVANDQKIAIISFGETPEETQEIYNETKKVISSQ